MGKIAWKNCMKKLHGKIENHCHKKFQASNPSTIPGKIPCKIPCKNSSQKFQAKIPVKNHPNKELFQGQGIIPRNYSKSK